MHVHLDSTNYIRFNERVVKAEFEHSTDKWIVQTLCSSGHDKFMSLTYESDLLLICNGHHNVPRYPRIPGIDAWLTSNRAAHAVFYRSPDCAPWMLEKSNKVLIIGGGPSGQDLVTDLIVDDRVSEVMHSASTFKDQNPGGVPRRGRLVRLGDVCRGEAEFEGGVVDEGIDFVILRRVMRSSFHS
jgi:cation diffusion facilitator CzcD-associated flavoprotein CzcO